MAWNRTRHCERSEAIQGDVRRLAIPGSPRRFAPRDDDPGARPSWRFRGQLRGETQGDLLRQRARQADLRVSRGAQVVIALLGAIVGRVRIGDASQHLRAAVGLVQGVSRLGGHGRRSRDVGERADRSRRRARRDGDGELIFWRWRLTGPVQIGGQIVGQIMADAVLDRLDFDCAQILDQSRVRGLAIERLEATGERARERKRRKDGETSRPRH